LTQQRARLHVVGCQLHGRQHHHATFVLRNISGPGHDRIVGSSSTCQKLIARQLAIY
jgi:hypothetical protein